MESNRLKLIRAEVDSLKAAIKGNDHLSALLNIQVPELWTEFGVPALQYSHDHLIANPEHADWWTYFPILKAENMLIGSGGFQGAPSNGEVEIGYEIAPLYRGNGFATEFAQLLCDHAWTHKEVEQVNAHTLAELNASVWVLKKCGFHRMEEFTNEEGLNVWKWSLRRD